VSFGRAIGALLAGDLVSAVALGFGVAYGNQLGAGGFWLLSLMGFVTTVLILHGGGTDIERGTDGYTYKVPPGAPPGWPGTDGS
jgi:hypothetical protein